MRALILSAFVVVIASPAMAFEHKDEVTTFATAVAVSQVVSDRCPDILAYPAGLAALQDSMHIVPGDDMVVQIQIRGLSAAFREDADRYGTDWCDQQIVRFGQDGTMMRGLLKRQ